MRVMVTGATTPLGVAMIDALLARNTTAAVLAIGHEATFGWDDPRVAYRAVDLRRWRDTHDLLFGIARDLEIDASYTRHSIAIPTIAAGMFTRKTSTRRGGSSRGATRIRRSARSCIAASRMSTRGSTRRS